MAAVERAKQDGVFIISTCIERTHGLAFKGLGRAALADPNQAKSFGPGSWWQIENPCFHPARFYVV
jgi:hypothetical protein